MRPPELSFESVPYRILLAYTLLSLERGESIIGLRYMVYTLHVGTNNFAHLSSWVRLAALTEEQSFFSSSLFSKTQRDLCFLKFITRNNGLTSACGHV
jgi:hypothetical protein